MVSLEPVLEVEFSRNRSDFKPTPESETSNFSVNTLFAFEFRHLPAPGQYSHATVLTRALKPYLDVCRAVIP